LTAVCSCWGTLRRRQAVHWLLKATHM
jgi:hypothetical protein